ncbi:MAG: UDP-N-acetylmuramoyl-L-alanyl-D-glutamate--2,6-diaminopimelate ligase [Clostridia bacterium]|nr:UDP-N-acetylmuramoyl-L-alanyl-D-glutamate--2,6-diaminopimelate ligase [Clostridia bacterium]
MRLSQIIERLSEKEIVFEGEADREIAALTTDSRLREKNSLFICLRGGKVDSHTCVKQAIKNGVVAIVSEKKLDVELPQILVTDTREALAIIAAAFYGYPSEKMKMIGITGTNGKTTTAHMFAEICKQSEKKVGVIGTLGISYGRKKMASDLTTPDPILLQKTLSDMYISGVEYVVMEVSAHALHYKKTSGIAFDACIFTNLTQDHLDFFEDMQTYKQTKTGLFSPENCPIAVLNGDEDVGREIGRMREESGQKTLFYGLNTPSDAFAVITTENLYGTECVLNLEDNLCRVSLKMTGRHNVYNALAAATCAFELGFTAEDAAKGLSSLEGVNGRLQRVGNHRGAEIYVDFAHTPDGLKQSLATLKKYAKGRVICLFGCGGNRDKGKRAIMGEMAAKYADFSILTSDNPRYEDPLDIISGIEKGYRRFSARYVVVPDRKTALDYALDFVKKDDVLLVAGKGGEEYQEIMGIKYPFNDQTVLEKLLRQKGKEFHF